jgi:hypothetical protein
VLSIAYYLHAVAVDGMSLLHPDELLEKHSLVEYGSQYMSDHLDHLTPCDHPTLTSTFHRLLHPVSNHIATRFSSLFFRTRWLSQARNIPSPALTLILAAHLGLSGVASWLLTFDTVQEQIDAFVSDFDCGQPILEAAAKKHMDVIRLLLGNGANINQEGKDGRNELFVTSQNGQETAVRMLIQAGAIINSVDARLMTPIQVASEHGHKGIVEMLIKAGVDMNLGSELALYCTSEGGHEDVVQTLILTGADINLEGELRTALHVASHYHILGRKVVELLIDTGANVNKLAGEYGTALQAAAAAAEFV